MTTTWIRLSLYGGDETTNTFLIPTLNISTYSDLTKAIHSIFRISAEAFPSFDVHTENDSECDNEAVFLLSPHLWDLGLYFSHAPEKAVEVFVHFKPPSAAPVQEKEEEQPAVGSPIKSRAASPKDEQHQHQEWSQDEIDAAEALLALSRAQPAPQLLPSPQPQQHHPQNSSKRARNSSTTTSSDSSSSGSSPIVRKRRARSLAGAPPTRHEPSSSSSAPLSSVPSSGLSSPPADDVLDAQAVDLQQQQQQHELDQQPLVLQQEEQEQEEQEDKRGTPPAPPAPQTVTLHLRYLNRMTRSHGATVPDLVLRAVPAARRLADMEDVVKNHACEAFLLLTMDSGESGGGSSGRGRRQQKQKLTQRQGLELVECLAVRVVLDGFTGDALRERKTVGEYAVGEEGEEGEEKVVRGTVEMWREEHIAMEVLRRESPTGDGE
ncbi:hypothetical protein DBV05_g5145 [Lasiodiplodia theobromae]|uniref:Uncharacterized protein n=1 Tax=Lasiodiplodia theobromae TaxID=45133 RepID=A0A5N5DEV8_9PEZI|nr:hypothetical protein DBV05_g5145 [Lasiodiplodia theobromae]